jgi:2-polyprenyl-6-methoxyphenol hydroxylase-like FAD-dependent oxidoreductase
MRTPEAMSSDAACCVVGGGPGGVMLSLLLARAGIRVTLLEAHHDFDRDFRGDTIHPSTLEVLDQIGLADRLHQLPHVKAPSFRIVSGTESHTTAVFSRLPTRFPYIMMMPQSRFLEFLIEEARRYPTFSLVMGARVQRLLTERGATRGVGYRVGDRDHEVRAQLTVGADGRFSQVRKLADIEPVSVSGTIEVIWLRLPRRPDDRHDEASLRVGDRHVAAILGRTNEWQVGCVLNKGGYQRLKHDGIESLRRSIATSVPWLADRVSLISDWRQINVLSVDASRVVTWHRPGLLLIGDAAHVMLPVGGVGINCAIADAVEAVNVLAEPLRNGRVEERHLAEVQRRRERYTKIIQGFQAGVQRGVAATIDSGKPFRPPLPVRLMLRTPILRNLPARLTAFGVKRVRLDETQIRGRPQDAAG